MAENPLMCSKGTSGSSLEEKQPSYAAFGEINLVIIQLYLLMKQTLTNIKADMSYYNDYILEFSPFSFIWTSSF